ncbi:MAG: T9SS type A sorting domain-containing protein [Tannerella sp.]|nr:T9SS type A sorting domain-containing protein [Tannerella sp.]
MERQKRKRIDGFFTGWLLMLFFSITVSGASQWPADERPAPGSGVKITVKDNRIVVADAPEKSVMEIYNVIGVKVQSIRLGKPSGEYAVTLPKGYYIVRIGGTVRKIVIR